MFAVSSSLLYHVFSKYIPENILVYNTGSIICIADKVTKAQRKLLSYGDVVDYLTPLLDIHPEFTCVHDWFEYVRENRKHARKGTTLLN